MVICNLFVSQMFFEEFEQAGLAASAYAGYDFDKVSIFEGKKLTEVLVTRYHDIAGFVISILSGRED